jgi:GAF domain-containing protein
MTLRKADRMNASVQSVGERSKGDTTAGYTLKSARPTRPVYGAVSSNQAVNELTETLKRTMASATTLLGVRTCWIAGLDPASRRLIQIAALSQDAAELSHIRSALHQRVASWVMTNRVSALINNMLSDPRCQGPGPALSGSMLSVPLLSGQQLLGTITVFSPTTGVFHQQALMMLQILADQTILAISKARQIEASQQQAQELAAFLDMAKAITSALDTQQMLHTVLAGIRRLVSCDEAVIYSAAEEVQELRAVARLGGHKAQLEKLRVPIGDKQSIAAWVAQNRRPILHEPGGRVFVGRITEELLGEDDLALLGAPLIARDQLRGVLMLGRFTPFDATELRVVLNLSSIVAIAVEHVDVQTL